MNLDKRIVQLHSSLIIIKLVQTSIFLSKFPLQVNWLDDILHFKGVIKWNNQNQNVISTVKSYMQKSAMTLVRNSYVALNEYIFEQDVFESYLKRQNVTF